MGCSDCWGESRRPMLAADLDSGSALTRMKLMFYWKDEHWADRLDRMGRMWKWRLLFGFAALGAVFIALGEQEAQLVGSLLWYSSIVM